MTRRRRIPDRARQEAPSPLDALRGSPPSAAAVRPQAPTDEAAAALAAIRAQADETALATAAASLAEPGARADARIPAPVAYLIRLSMLLGQDRAAATHIVKRAVTAHADLPDTPQTWLGIYRQVRSQSSLGVGDATPDVSSILLPGPPPIPETRR